ncbi:hypothetical protein B0T17DRAFT_619255 [Bombardia bombarda]|uniref:Uncharacterized protein n=1 Tax=Bombardia bombarda TaxID=252184 RepID=A0AA40BVU6_9PEZI|nr:hypothetical protein B0T17DRAFT_619255 [Bombardia bombarda]
MDSQAPVSMDSVASRAANRAARRRHKLKVGTYEKYDLAESEAPEQDATLTKTLEAFAQEYIKLGLHSPYHPLREQLSKEAAEMSLPSATDEDLMVFSSDEEEKPRSRKRHNLDEEEWNPSAGTTRKRKLAACSATLRSSSVSASRSLSASRPAKRQRSDQKQELSDQKTSTENVKSTRRQSTEKRSTRKRSDQKQPRRSRQPSAAAPIVVLASSPEPERISAPEPAPTPAPEPAVIPFSDPATISPPASALISARERYLSPSSQNFSDSGFFPGTRRLLFKTGRVTNAGLLKEVTQGNIRLNSLTTAQKEKVMDLGKDPLHKAFWPGKLGLSSGQARTEDKENVFPSADPAVDRIHSTGYTPLYQMMDVGRDALREPIRTTKLRNSRQHPYRRAPADENERPSSFASPKGVPANSPFVREKKSNSELPSLEAFKSMYKGYRNIREDEGEHRQAQIPGIRAEQLRHVNEEEPIAHIIIGHGVDASPERATGYQLDEQDVVMQETAASEADADEATVAQEAAAEENDARLDEEEDQAIPKTSEQLADEAWEKMTANLREKCRHNKAALDTIAREGAARRDAAALNIEIEQLKESVAAKSVPDNDQSLEPTEHTFRSSRRDATQTTTQTTTRRRYVRKAVREAVEQALAEMKARMEANAKKVWMDEYAQDKAALKEAARRGREEAARIKALEDRLMAEDAEEEARGQAERAEAARLEAERVEAERTKPMQLENEFIAQPRHQQGLDPQEASWQGIQNPLSAIGNPSAGQVIDMMSDELVRRQVADRLDRHQAEMRAQTQANQHPSGLGGGPMLWNGQYDYSHLQHNQFESQGSFHDWEWEFDETII